MSDTNALSSKALGKPLGGEYAKELAGAKARRKTRLNRVGAIAEPYMARESGRNRKPVTAHESRFLLDQSILAHARKRGQK